MLRNFKEPRSNAISLKAVTLKKNIYLQIPNIGIIAEPLITKILVGEDPCVFNDLTTD